MATEDDTSTPPEDGGEQDDQQQDLTPEDGANDGQQQVKDDGKLPDDHPVVKALAKANAKSATQATELSEARAKAANATKLEEELAKRPTVEALETLQTRYDRLEAFLAAAGGPLSKALDSRTFTRELFETDNDIEKIVKDWQKANPTATSVALGSKAGAVADKKPVQNDLLRAALSPSS